MANSKFGDLAILREFLNNERHRYEALNSLHGAIGRIDNLAAAEVEAKRSLEAAQADLAWTQVELGAARADLEMARGRYAEEIGLLEADARIKRQEVEKLVATMEVARTAMAMIMNSLMKTSGDA